MANSTLHIYDVTFLEVFSGSFILCDFHHIKARETYIRKKSNEIPQDILPFLTRITESSTEVQYKANLAVLKGSDQWKSSQNLQNLF